MVAEILHPLANVRLLSDAQLIAVKLLAVSLSSGSFSIVALKESLDNCRTPLPGNAHLPPDEIKGERLRNVPL